MISNADPTAGPVRRKLAEFGRVRGFVFGANGEASDDIHAWVEELARMGAHRRWRQMGARSMQEAKGLIKKIAIETLGIEAVRGNAKCKLDRLGVALDGGAWRKDGAARRREARFHRWEQQDARRRFDGYRRANRFAGHRWRK